MDKQKRNDYEAPALTVVNFKAEHGYALSGVGASRSSYSYTDNGNSNDGSNSNQSWF